MSKQQNPNIGHLNCPICGDASAVRRNRAGRFYFDCMHCGRITPNHGGGQRFVMENATIWGAGGPPADVPKWIAEQWPYGKAVRHKTPQPAPAPAPEPDTAAPPPAAAPGIATLPPPPKRDATPAAKSSMFPNPPRGFSFLED